MRFFLNIAILLCFFAVSTNGQKLTREQKLNKLNELNEQLKILEKSLLAPDASDLKPAKNNVGVFRLMPRESFDRRLRVQGGGSFYSFKTLSHDYQKTPQINLEKNFLSVGFAGADYGLITDVGEVALDNLTAENTAVNILANYKVPKYESEIRAERIRSYTYDLNGIIFKDNVQAIVGHSYILRAISFEQADSLVAFKIHRRDTDGSLIIFWKMLGDFEKPTVLRGDSVVISETPVNFTVDYETTAAVQNALVYIGLIDVIVSATTTEITLRGTVPKGKMAQAVQTVSEVAKRKIVNQLTEK